LKHNYFACSILFTWLVVGTTVVNALDLGDLVNKNTLEKLGNSKAQNLSPAAQQDSSSHASAAGLEGISNKDQVGSLRQALTQGAEMAVDGLSKENGFLGNDKVRIPLPDSLQKAEKVMREVGMGRYADELITSMNHAAEAAVPEAKSLLIGALKKMSVGDAKDILMGSNDAATQYFRKNTEAGLAERFKPIVSSSMQKVNLAEKYNQFAEKGVKLGLINQNDANLDDYITHKAMDGLFLMIAEQEKAIRANPLQATGLLAQKVFSAIKF